MNVKKKIGTSLWMDRLSYFYKNTKLRNASIFRFFFFFFENMRIDI